MIYWLDYMYHWIYAVKNSGIYFINGSHAAVRQLKERCIMVEVTRQ